MTYNKVFTTPSGGGGGGGAFYDSAEDNINVIPLSAVNIFHADIYTCRAQCNKIIITFK